MSQTTPVDSGQRSLALDPTQSFIVQAPAGSGKTGLLVRRFLLLLSSVNRPEEILAITFTRKATAEMKERILSALVLAKAHMTQQTNTLINSEPEIDLNPGLDEIQILALAALQNDAKHQWDIINNPARLRIQTIDAFCYELIRHMPWSSRFGSPPLIVEDSEPLYLTAAKRTLDHVESSSQWAVHCEHLLRLVDANFGRAQQLLAMMLMRRDRWMRGLPSGTREQFEAMWVSVVEQTLESIHQRLTPGYAEEIKNLLVFSATKLAESDPTHPQAQFQHLQHFPSPRIDDLPIWQGVAGLLLTGGGKIRGRVTKKEGFPPDDKPAKQRMDSLLQSLHEEVGMEAALASIRSLPDGKFNDQQWLTIDSLLQLLPLAAAELRLLFKEQNQTDYVELTQRAESALGPIDAPTDLALSFDYRLKHVLVDEFQDTSKAQIDLLLKLTAGWQENDGRTLFLVGDPMQSIYRFREADVGHFLNVQRSGLGEIQPEPVRLESNFRSAPALVDWFNHSFQTVFPKSDDIVNGAVKYNPATPYQSTDSLANVQLHSLIDQSRETEAHQICERINEELSTNPNQKIAVLGRGRTHLRLIAEVLRDKGVAFQATEMEAMAQNPTILDLVSLTRAMLQPTDRIAWLSILRAPWCGLTLDDISALTENGEQLTILELIYRATSAHSTSAHSTSAQYTGYSDTSSSDTDHPAEQKVVGDHNAIQKEANSRITLTKNGLTRLIKLIQALSPALALRGRVSLRRSVESAWFNLSAPSYVSPAQFNDCRLFFELIDQLEANHLLITPSLIDNAVAKLWTQSQSEANVQLLTIHKAKGLEFDTVIIPGLERTPRHPDRELLAWARLPDQLLIALLPSSGEEDKFYRFIGKLEQSHQRNELSRLLYVACTRAQKRLHLFANFKVDKQDEIKPPPSSSLLHLLWPIWATQAEKARKRQAEQITTLDIAGSPNTKSPDFPEEDADTPALGHSGNSGITRLFRLPLGFAPPKLPDDLITSGTLVSTDEQEIEYAWATDTARIVGIVIHQLLQQIDIVGWNDWLNKSDEQIIAQATVALLENGLEVKDKQHGIKQVTLAIGNVRRDPKAQWIFSPSHQQIKAEWALTSQIDGKISTVIMDRTFVDEHGVRWIIDFKSSRHEDEDVDRFISEEKTRYQHQLAKYARVLSQLEDRETQLGLYFPLLNAWTQWPSPYQGNRNLDDGNPPHLNRGTQDEIPSEQSRNGSDKKPSNGQVQTSLFSDEI